MFHFTIKFYLISIFFIVISTSPITALPSSFDATVTKVIDGDSIHVKFKNEPIKCRLIYIDAPEHKQQYGNISHSILSRLILNKVVHIHYYEKDSYNRALVVVFLIIKILT